MGAVYLATETSTGRRVALKLLAPELARDERFRRRFVRESELAATLDHPGIVPTIARGEEDGTLYLAMDYIEGTDLRKLLRAEGRLDPQRAFQLLDDVARALDAAHVAGLVHRDVKPGNILVAAGRACERAYLCDFGLARHVSSASSLTSDRGFVGTIDYVPPEQIEGGDVDGRADVYSLGCVLFECLAGGAPFERETELAVLFSHLNDPPPRLSDRQPGLPAAFDKVFETALAKAPDQRYSSCIELIDAARAALAGKTVLPRKVRRRRRLAAAAIVLVGVSAAATLAVTRGPPSDRAASGQSLGLTPNAINLIDARTGHVTAHIQLASPRQFVTPVEDVVEAAGFAWLLDGADQRLVRVDLGTHKVAGVVKLPWSPGQRLAAGGGLVWVHEDIGAGVLGIDPRTGTVVRRLEIDGGGIDGIAYGAGSLWLAQNGAIIRVDARTGSTIRRYAVPARWLAFADGALWAAAPGDGLVTKIDPVEGRVAHVRLHAWITDIAVGANLVWVSLTPGDSVFKLDEADLSVQGSIPAGPDPERLSFGGGGLWIANTAGDSVSRVDALSGRRTRLAAAARPSTVLYHDGLVAVAAARAPAPLPPISGEVLRISTPTDDGNYGSPDPLNFDQTSQQLLYATCASLLDYPDAAGRAGTRLVPEVATSMPAVSDGGRTYTFHIRPGFRFSPPSNEPVTAKTFRHSLERELSPRNRSSPGPQFATDIAGVAAYRAGRRQHISGIHADGNTLSITLIRPAGDFLTRLSMSAFCPVPLSVPVYSKRHVRVPPPSDGPYYVTSVEGDRTVLIRNPNYPGDRPRRPARIVLTTNVPTAKAVALANAGATDLLPWDFDTTTDLLLPGGLLDRREGAASKAARSGRQRYFLYRAPFVDYVVLNAGRPLFRHRSVRRAVNYALDRPALARSFADAADDQIVPAAVPGFAPGRVYPIDGPNLVAARRLMGGRRYRARLYFCDDPHQRPVASILRSNLGKIGITVTIDHAQNCPNGYDKRSRRADLILAGGLGGPERDPEPFLDQALARDGRFGSALGRGLWTSGRFRRELAHARVLRGVARMVAYRSLTAELTRSAPFAVYGGWVWSEFFSPTVGCKVFQGEYGFVDLGALCRRGGPP